MFGTLRYEPQDNEVSFRSGLGQHHACDNCRARKLKCGGQKPSCKRCHDSGIVCTFPEPNSGNRKRHKKTSSDRSKEHKQSTKAAETTDDRDTNDDIQMLSEPIKEQQFFDGVSDMSYLSNVDPFARPLGSFVPSVPSLDSESTASDPLLQDMFPAASPSDVFSNLESPNFLTQSDLDTSTADLQKFLPVSNLTKSPHDLSIPSPFPTDPSDCTHFHKQANNRRFCAPKDCDKSATDLNPLSVGLPSRRQQSSSSLTRLDSNNSDLAGPDGSKDCRCLDAMLSVLEQLENGPHLVISGQLDVVLVRQKNALDECTRRMHCATCAKKSTFLKTIRLISANIISIDSHISATNIIKQHRSNSTASSTSSIQQQKDTKTQARVQQPETISFGNYQVQTPAERAYVVCVLVALQLRQLATLLVQMETAAERYCSESEVATLQKQRQKLRSLIDRISGLARGEGI